MQHKLVYQSVQCLETKVNGSKQFNLSISELKRNVYELSPKGRKQISKVVGEQSIASV